MMHAAHEVAIERLLPHRGAMRWIDRLLACDEDEVTVEATVRDDAPLALDGGVPGWAGIEYMAQAIAVWAGVRALARGEPIRPGFLLGSRRYECSVVEFAVGRTLRVVARRELFGDNGLGVFACRILGGDAVLASANVSVFEPPEPQRFLESVSR